jgi:hypothetical protein
VEAQASWVELAPESPLEELSQRLKVMLLPVAVLAERVHLAAAHSSLHLPAGAPCRQSVPVAREPAVPCQGLTYLALMERWEQRQLPLSPLVRWCPVPAVARQVAATQVAAAVEWSQQVAGLRGGPQPAMVLTQAAEQLLMAAALVAQQNQWHAVSELEPAPTLRVPLTAAWGVR